MTNQEQQNIAFVANFFLTPTMYAAAQRLERDGSEVHWLVFSRRWYRWLRTRGVKSSRLIALYEASDDPSRQGLRPTEAFDPPIEHLISTDRVLRHRDSEVATSLLHAVAALAVREIARRQIEVVFGEATWAAEVAIGYALQEIGVPYLAPTPTRVPSGRLGFVHAPSQARLIDLHQGDTREFRAEAEVLYTAFRRRDSSDIWAHNQFSVGRYLAQPGMWVDKAWDAVTDSSGNPTQRTLVSYVRNKNPLRLFVNARRLRVLVDSIALRRPQELGQPFVLMPLQVQPEASVDVVAWAGSDQAKNIRAVSEAVGEDVIVAVKEHSHRFGSRDVQFFRDAIASPKIVLVHPDADAREWSRNALAVIAPSGTMCLENALEGRRSVVFAPIFFDVLPSVLSVVPDDTDLIRSFLEEEVSRCTAEAAIEYLAMVLQRSMPGRFTAERDVPGSLSDDNVRELAEAFSAASRAMR